MMMVWRHLKLQHGRCVMMYRGTDDFDLGLEESRTNNIAVHLAPEGGPPHHHVLFAMVLCQRGLTAEAGWYNDNQGESGLE